MASNVRVGIDFVLNQPAIKQQLDQVARMMRQTLSGVTVDASGTLQGFERIRQAARQAGQEQRKQYTDTASAAKAAAQAIAAEEKRLADLKAKYSADAFIKGRDSAKNRAKAEEAAVNAIVADMKRMQDQRAAIQTAITKTEDAEVKKRLQTQNKALLDELRLAKQVALDKDAISKGGAGGKVGVLGTGRQIAGDQLGGNLGGLVSGVGGKAMMASAGIGIAVSLAKEGIGIFADFQTSMADLSAITGLTGEKLKQAGNDARELGLKFGIDGKDGVESMKLVISALGPGVAQNREALKGMTDTVLTFAKAGTIEGQEAANALTVTMSQYGYATADAATQLQVMNRIANVQAAASKEGSAEIKDLAESMKVAGATANNAGISIEQTAAWLEMLAPAGIKGAEAGTAFRNMVLKMSAGSKEGTEALKAMGLTYDQINPKKVGMVKAVETLKQGYEKLKNPVDKAAATQKLFGMENANAATIMMQSVGQVENFTQKITGTATAQEMAATKMDTLKEGFNRFMVQIKDVAISLVEKLKPGLDFILMLLSKLAPVLSLVGDVIGFIVTLNVKFYTGVYRLVKAFAEWVAQSSFVKSAIAWISGAVSTLIGWVSSAWDWIKNLASGFYQWASSIAPVKAAMDTVATAIGWVIEKAKEAWGWIKKVAGWSGMVDDSEPATATTTASPGGVLGFAMSVAGQTQTAMSQAQAAGQVEAGSDEHIIGKGKEKGGGGKKAEQQAQEAFDKEFLNKETAYNAKLHELSLQRRNNLLTEEQFAIKELEAKIALNAEKLALAKQYNQDVVSITREGELLLLDLRDAQYKREKALLESSLTEQLAEIERNLLDSKISDDQAKGQRVRAEQAHNDKLIALAKAYNQEYLQEQRNALKLTIEVGKVNLEEAVSAARDVRDSTLQHLDDMYAAGNISEEVYLANRQQTLQHFLNEATAAVREHGAESKEVNKEIAASDRELTKTKRDEEKKRREDAERAIQEEKKRLDELRQSNLGYQQTYSQLTNVAKQSMDWLDSRWKASFKNQETVLFQALSLMSETTKNYLANIASQYADKIAIIVGKNLAAAGSYMMQAVGSLISWQMSLGWWNLALIPAEIATLYYMYDSAKKLFGFAKGGLVPGGEKVVRVNEEGQEFVINADATQRFRPLLEALNQPGAASKPLPPEVLSSIHIGRFSTGGRSSVPVNPTGGAIPPEQFGSIHIGRFSSGGLMEVPKGPGRAILPEALGSIHIGRFSSGGLVEVPSGQGGVLPELLQSIHIGRFSTGGRSSVPVIPQGGAIAPEALGSIREPELPISRRDSVADTSSLIQEMRALREDYRNRPPAIIMDQRRNLLSQEQEKHQMRKERL